MKLYGLIGFPLSHSFSKKYFASKFEKEHITDCRYELFELKTIKEFPSLVASISGLKGLNVTIPYKQDVKQFLHQFDVSAEKVGAVNVIKVDKGGILTGFNSDYYGFKRSLESWLPHLNFKALVLGSGGASKAVVAALNDLKIPFLLISRQSGNGDLTYEQLNEDLTYYRSHQLIVNTTPLGMSPHTEGYPDLLYDLMGETHYLYDLVYNPEETKMMTLGALKGANVKNGLEMLHLQAEKSWEIWNG